MLKKTMSALLCLGMLACAVLPASAAPANSIWYNGDIMTPYKNNHAFLNGDSPFSYAFYYEGTDPYDTRAAGFYDMILADNMDAWANGYYFCGLSAKEAKDGTNDNRINTIMQSCVAAPTFHYSAGYVFTAPYTGTVEFTYQFAKAYGGSGCDNHVIRVLRDVEDPYNNGAIATYTPSETLYGEGSSASGDAESKDISVDVKAGEKIYFLVDNHDGNGGMTAHWVKSAKYTAGDIPEETTQAAAETTTTTMAVAAENSTTLSTKSSDAGAVTSDADQSGPAVPVVVSVVIGAVVILVGAAVFVIVKRKKKNS